MTDPLDLLLAGAPEELTSEKAALAALDRAEGVDPLPESSRLRPRLPEKGVTVGAHRLLARALEAEGEDGEADQVLVAVAERLNQAGYWRALTRVVRTFLERSPRDAAPLLARARSKGGSDAVDDALLETAQGLAPGHGLLTWLAADAARGRGDTTRARRLAARALPELMAEKDYETAESALLLLAEGPGGDAVPPVLESLTLLGRQEAWGEFDAVLDLCGDALSAPRGAAAAWPVLRELWRRHPEHDPLRAAALRVAKTYLTRYPDPAAMLRISEIERPSQTPEGVLGRLAKAERFPPGWYARHMGWGIGPIRDNDTEAVIVDFPGKPAHRMSMGTAEQALDALPPDHLAVLLALRPDEPVRLSREDPAGLVVKALQCTKDGKAASDELRKVLVPAVIASGSWASWWKGCKDALAADPRVDTRRAYAGEYRLAGDGDEDEIAFPAWEAAKDPAKNLALLETFLAQHPGLEEEVLDSYRDRLDGLIGGRKSEAAAAAGLFLLRLDPASGATPESRLRPGFDVNALSKRDQDALLARPLGPMQLTVLLDSRASTVRREAAARLRADGALAQAARTVLGASREHPEGALELLEDPSTLESLPPPDPALDPLFVFAALDLLEHPPREPHRRRVLALLEPGSPFGRRLAAGPFPDDRRSTLVSRLVRWESSDRFRFPFLDFLKQVGLEGVASSVEGARARQAAVLSDRVEAAVADDAYDGALLLSRPTLTRLQEERLRLGMDLKTVIPQAIQKARELGDLRENAEYAAAKAKQANAAQRFEELDRLIHAARLIEELKREEGVGAPGTEVDLTAASGDRVTVWILGEGDQEVGAGVVSYRAPVGKALLGCRAGDEVILPFDGGSTVYRVAAVRERLP